MLTLWLIAVLFMAFIFYVVNEREKRAEIPCEELIKQNNSKEYTPIPKRCEEEK